LPKIVGGQSLSASSGQVECLLPADAVGDDVQEPLRDGHVVAVALHPETPPDQVEDQQCQRGELRDITLLTHRPRRPPAPS
jgi:hypothetical protein